MEKSSSDQQQVVTVTESMEKNEKVLVPKDEPDYRGIAAMPYVIGNETFEKLGTIGTATNLLVYLTSSFHMKSIAATNLVNIFNGTCNFGGLLGAYVCDTYFGRYKTIGFASVSSFFGMMILTLTAAVPTLHPPSCENKRSDEICKEASTGQMAFLITGFVLLIIGASGIRPCNLAFGADQFYPNTESGRKGTNSFFNWYYFTYTFAVMVSSTVIVYVQTNVSWPIGFAIPTFLMFLSCALFFAGSWIYVKVLPQGSPITSVAQVIAVAIKKRGLKLPKQNLTLFNHIPNESINMKLPHTDQFRFLDKAAIVSPEDQINSDGSVAKTWNLCTVQQVEEVKCMLRMVPIWIAGIVFEISGVQLGNFVVFQALQSDRRLLRSSSFKIPAGTYFVFSMAALSVWLPIYDRIVIPFIRRYTKKEDGITQLQRMGIGMVLTIFALFVAGIVEDHRRTVALTRPTLGFAKEKGAISSMSAWWYIPQVALFGLAQGFTYIGENELFYKQSPENMRSIAASLVLCGVALSSYLSSVLTEIVRKATTKGTRNWLAQDLNKAKLDNFFYIVAGLEILNLGYFLLCAKWYRYRGIGDTALELAATEKVQPEKPAV